MNPPAISRFLPSRAGAFAAFALVLLGIGSAHAAADGRTLYDAQCALCHGGAGSGAGGPPLTGIVGRPVASRDFAYTDALRRFGGTWDAARLDRFLANPQATVPGTAMAVRVRDDGKRRAIVAYLGALPDAPATRGAQSAPSVVFGDWRSDAPGRVHRIAVSDLPAPFATESARNSGQIVARPIGLLPQVPEGFSVGVFAEGLQRPRQLRVAPNGDVFVTETDAGRVRVLRPGADGTRAASNAVWATGLDEPFGLGFFPTGAEPRWLYVAETNRVVRYRYTPGSTTAGAPDVVLPRISPTSAGHSNRDLAIATDDRTLYVGVGSSSNVADGMSAKPVDEARRFAQGRGPGAAWDAEEGRAAVLAFTPEGKQAHLFATGIRNCSGIAVQPATGALWCSTNERDGLGDDLVPDYVTRVKEGAFYGWPWWYIGDHEDPRRHGERPDLKAQVALPDVLLQPHAASLGIFFADGAKLPARWQHSAFAAEHGSWNRANRTGPKLIRIELGVDGTPTGAYEDVMTGFVLDDRRVWGRPVGVAVAKDGSLLVSDDAGGVIWRIAYHGP